MKTLDDELPGTRTAGAAAAAAAGSYRWVAGAPGPAGSRCMWVGQDCEQRRVRHGSNGGRERVVARVVAVAELLLLGLRRAIASGVVSGVSRHVDVEGDGRDASGEGRAWSSSCRGYITLSLIHI